VNALDRKLLRDLTRHRGQVISIAFVVACGVMTVVAMRGTLEAIRDARDAYYAAYRFADVFATLKRAPEAVGARIRAIPGVGAVETRITLPVTLRVPHLAETATGHLVSVPAVRRPMPNDLVIRRGRYVAADRDDEVLVSDHFATINGLQLGDSLGAVINGRWQQLRVVGIATSPEFVAEVAGNGFFVDGRRFAILWMRRQSVAAAGGFDGAFNDVALILAPGARAEPVIAAIDALLAPYGGIGAVGREHQISNNIISDELHQLSAIGNVFPLFFLGTAAFLLNVVLSRLISTQRDQLGTLKAFGYENRAIARHYLGFAGAAVVLGSLLGLVGGLWMGTAYTNLYTEFFRFPVLAFRIRASSAMIGIVVSGTAALGGALAAVRRGVRLAPAEAMRPPSPARYRPLLIERLGFGAAMPITLRMILRNLERRPLRTLASVTGIALAGAVLVTGVSPYDGVSHLMNIVYGQAQREDLTVGFTGPRSGTARQELTAIPGVRHVELFRATPVRLRNGYHVRTTSITGLDRGAALHVLVDAAGERHSLPDRGLVVSSLLARALGVRANDTLTIELLDRGNVQRRLAIGGIIDEFVGIASYMDREALNRLLREGDVATGAYLGIDRAAERDVFDRLQQIPLVAGVTSRAAIIDYFNRTTAESIAITTVVVVFAAVVLTVGVIYNGSRIALAERGRDLGSLRVLGFTRQEVSRMFIGEQAAIAIAGVPPSFLVGFGFTVLLIHAFTSERFQFPVRTRASTYLIAALVVLVSAAVVALVVRRKIDRLDLIAVLKTGE
jgi:putative ABC transport system permease protein